MTDTFLKVLPDILTCVMFIILILRTWRHEAEIKMMKDEMRWANEQIQALHVANTRLQERLNRSFL